MSNVSLASFVSLANVAIDARIASRVAIATTKKTNDKYTDDLNKSRTLFNNEVLATTLFASNVDASSFASIQLNAISKKNHLIEYILTERVKLNEYISEIFVSAFDQQKNNRDAVFTKSDAFNALDREYYMKHASESEKEYLVCYYKTISASTISSQHESTLQALVALNILTFVSTHAHRNAYVVNFDNELTMRFARKLNIIIDAVESDDAE